MHEAQENIGQKRFSGRFCHTFFMASFWRAGAVLLLAVFSLLSGTSAQDLAGQVRAAQAAGDYQKAATLYGQLIAAGEDSPEIRSNYGAVLYFCGRDREALEQLRIALKNNPSLVAPNLLAGMALSRLGEWSAAVAHLERARRQEPTSSVPLLALAKAYVGLHDYRRAHEAYAAAAALDAGNAEAWYGAGITARSLADSILKKTRQCNGECEGLLRDALQALTRAVALEPASPRAHLILAESYRDSGKFSEALTEYETALRLDPQDAAANLGLATTYWKTGDPEKAIPYLGTVLKRLPNDAEANGIMANVLVRRGDFLQALPFAQKALAGNPNLAQVRFSLAKIYMEQGQEKRAIDELRKITPVDPDGTYHFLLARALRSLGRDAESDAALTRFKELRAQSKGLPTQPE